MRTNPNDNRLSGTVSYDSLNHTVAETAPGNISESLTQSFEEPARQVGCIERAIKKSTPPWAAYTIDGFCFAYRVSRAQLYVLFRRGDGPRTYFVGRRRYVSLNAAAEWVRHNEALAATLSMRGADR